MTAKKKVSKKKRPMTKKQSEAEEPQDISEEKSSGIAGTDSGDVADGSASVSAEEENKIKILSEKAAKAFVKKNYQVPEGTKTVLVTEDRNVFYPDHESEGINHAQRLKLKYFRIEWD